MKRSEMIMELATEIVLYDAQIDYGTAQDLAITILAKAEELGMSPPLLHPIHHFQADMIQALDREYRKWGQE